MVAIILKEHTMIKFVNVNKTYPNGTVALTDVNLEIKKASS